MIDPRKSTLDELITWLADLETTHARLGGGVLDALLRRSDLGRQLSSVREMSLFGSRRDWSQVPLIRKLCSDDVSVVNGYSATEVGNICQFISTPGCDVLIGRIPNGTLPIDRLKLVDCDEGQEIWVRDPDAIEYLGDPDLTAKRFVTDEAGVRWWRSGDLGRIDDDGNFYFTGRIDHMVKINGMRVEPGETEHVLRSMPGVTTAAVLAHPTTHGGHRLIGHVCVDDETLTPEELRSQLLQVLPTHLVPAFFVRHDELPLTDRQKLDRQALLSRPVERWSSTPRSPMYIESVIWLTAKVQEIIGLGPVHPHDDIWEAGLDSLGAVELCTAIAAAGLGELNPTTLLTARRPIDIDRQVASGRTISDSPCVTFNEAGQRTPIFAIPGTGGTSFAYRSLASSLGDDQPLIVIEPRGMHSTGPIERTIAARVDSAFQAITDRMEPGSTCILLGYSGGTTIALEVARRLESDGIPVHLVFLDGSPRDGTLREDAPRHEPLPPFMDRMRVKRQRASWPSIIAVGLKRRVRRRVERLAIRYWAPIRLRRPGSRRFPPSHYEYFGLVQQRALRNFTLQPLDVEATLIHIEGSTTPARCAQWVARLETFTVGGDHHSMLHPPHVAAISEIVSALQDRLSPSAT